MEDSVIEKKLLNKKLLVRHGVYLFLLLLFLGVNTWLNKQKLIKDFFCFLYINYVFNIIYYFLCIVKKDTKKYTGKFLYNFINFCFNLSFEVFFDTIVYLALKNQLPFFNFINSSETTNKTENQKITTNIFENIFPLIVSLIIIVINYFEVVLDKKEDKYNLSTQRHFTISLLLNLSLLIISMLFKLFDNGSDFNITDYLIIIVIDVFGICFGECIYRCLTKPKKKTWSDENSDDGENLTELEDKK